MPLDQGLERSAVARGGEAIEKLRLGQTHDRAMIEEPLQLMNDPAFGPIPGRIHSYLAPA